MVPTLGWIAANRELAAADLIAEVNRYDEDQAMTPNPADAELRDICDAVISEITRGLHPAFSDILIIARALNTALSPTSPQALQGGPDTTLQVDTAHHAAPVTADQHAAVNTPSGIGVGALGSLPTVGPGMDRNAVIEECAQAMAAKAAAAFDRAKILAATPMAQARVMDAGEIYAKCADELRALKHPITSPPANGDEIQ